jgi:hypothetical protein
MGNTAVNWHCGDEANTRMGCFDSRKKPAVCCRYQFRDPVNENSALFDGMHRRGAEDCCDRKKAVISVTYGRRDPRMG